MRRILIGEICRYLSTTALLPQVCSRSREKEFYVQSIPKALSFALKSRLRDP